MRILVMFDLPTNTKAERKKAARFRKELQNLGFFMIQYSVYVRVVRGNERQQSVANKVKAHLPPKGSVRMLTITEKQYENMDILIGEPKSKSEKITGEQLLFEF
ncbi:CRISPR-associated endonuclease Cas2 [Helicobacter sp. 16-1353]|nr:CRISPR-associated endonuclease Cas2 [Helicobacter sp. 16-1353]